MVGPSPRDDAVIAGPETSGRSGFGVNYLPAYAGLAMWRDFRPGEIRPDLEALRSEGVADVRCFLSWPDFMPTPDAVDAEMMEHLASFLEILDGLGLRVQVTLLVGHMSGTNWVPPWITDPSAMYSDPDLRSAQAVYVRAVARCGRRFDSVESYCLSNESTRLTGPADDDVVGAWAEDLCRAVKEEHPAAMVALGDGAWYVLGERNGFRPTHAQDVIGPHLYLADTDPDRLVAGHGLAVGLAVALAEGRPVWLEEFGAPHSVFGEDQIAEFAEGVTVEARLQGAERVYWWSGIDVSTADALPYEHHAFELTFGVLRADRTARPASKALRQATAAELPDLPEAGLLVPSYLHEVYPFSFDDPELILRTLRTAYAALRRLGFCPRVVLERDLDAANDVPELLVAPSVQKLLAPTWERLEARPGRLLFSYLHGSSYFHGAWTHRARTFFG
ncbi:MAG: hypothetical protein ABR518_06485, partial [Actinomycetota bacterium]